jgi:PBP1b-binding outer membrane lipoprotein LpoB
MIKKLFFQNPAVLLVLLAILAWSCKNTSAPEQESGPAAQEVVTPESTPEVAVDTTVLDTSAKQRPIIRQ